MSNGIETANTIYMYHRIHTHKNDIQKLKLPSWF